MRNKSVLLRITITLLCLVLLHFPQLAPYALEVPGQLDTQAVDDYVQSWMEIYDVPGVAVGIVQDNQVTYLKGYGEARLFREPVTPQTPGVIGSVGKTFTALAILQFANQGKLSPGDPLVKHLPEFRTADAASVYEKISLYKLINHQSGLSRQDGVNGLLYERGTNLKDVLDWLATIRIKEDRGDTSYSNLNYILLGAVIEKITGMKAEDYIRQNILVPLEMENSFYVSQDSGGYSHARPPSGIWLSRTGQ